jgi:hypothetical protein
MRHEPDGLKIGKRAAFAKSRLKRRAVTKRQVDWAMMMNARFIGISDAGS